MDIFEEFGIAWDADMDGGGPNNAAVQQKRGVFHALPAPEIYTIE